MNNEPQPMRFPSRDAAYAYASMANTYGVPHHTHRNDYIFIVFHEQQQYALVDHENMVLLSGW